MLCMKQKVSTNEFGKRLAQIRRERGLSQRALAKLVGTSGRMIAYYEKKAASLPIEFLEPICDALGVSADELVGLKPHKHDVDPKEYFLWKRFKKAEKLSVRDKKALFHFLNALLSKNPSIGSSV